MSHLFSSDPEKKEKRRIEKEERARIRAQRKHDQRIASKQVLADEWHPVNFPYQAPSSTSSEPTRDMAAHVRYLSAISKTSSTKI